MKKNTLIIFMAILMLVMSGCASEVNQNTKEPLIVGMELAYPPFETKDESGKPMGISVDLAYALGEYLDRPVEIENTNWDGLIPSLQTGKVDVVISSMTITDERREVIDFSIPYAQTYLGLLVNKNAQINEAADLNDSTRTIAVKKGTTGDVYANKNLQNATINRLSSESACVTEVVQGKADAFIYDLLTIYRQNKENPDTTEAILVSFKDGEEWGMAVKKGDDELLEQINTFIKTFKENQGFDALNEKYLKDEKEVFDARNFPWFFD